VKQLEATGEFPAADIETMNARVKAFGSGSITFQQIRAEMFSQFPADELNFFLQLL
jgi:hypothetical protein